MNKIRDFLKGKKTYIVACIIGVTTFLYYAGLIDGQTYDMVFKLLAGLGLVTLRAGINKNKQ